MRTGPLLHAALALLITLAAVTVVQGATTTAQDVSGGGARCGPPVAASPTTLLSATPLAAVTTTATPMPAADTRTSAAVDGAVTTVAACWNDNNWTALGALVTADFMAARLGIADPGSFGASMTALDQAGLVVRLQVERAEFVRTDGATVATIEVRWRQASARFADLWHFVVRDGGWRLQAITPLPPTYPGEVVGISVQIGATALAPSRTEVVETPMVALDLTNPTSAPVTFTVLAVSEAVDLPEIVAGTAAGKIAVAGALALPPGGRDELRLESLPVGDYLLVADLNAAVFAAQPGLARATPFTVIPQPSS